MGCPYCKHPPFYAISHATSGCQVALKEPQIQEEQEDDEDDDEELSDGIIEMKDCRANDTLTPLLLRH